MKLVIDNIGKIKHADLEFRGITVVAGNNNTGKSTIGKTLFATFNSLRNLDEKIEEEKQKERVLALSDVIADQAFENRKGVERFSFRFRLREFENVDLSNRKDVEDKLRVFLKRHLISLPNEKDFFLKVWKKIDEVNSVKNKDIISILVERVFKSIFNGQINSLMFINKPVNIELTIKKKNIKLSFRENQNVSQDIPIRITNKAVFIQSPNIIDSLDNDKFIFWDNDIVSTNSLENHLLHLLKNEKRQTAVAAAQARKKLEKVYQILSEVIPGQLVRDTEGKLIYNEKGFAEPLSVENLSTGLKSFALLYLLLANGTLEDKDVLILDEPEVHLHPEWQLKYAELIALLEKVFDLTILLTTHSPYFLRAIEMFSRKYKIEDHCDYYLAKINDNDNVKIKQVNNNIDCIYQEMANPLDILNAIDDNLNKD